MHPHREGAAHSANSNLRVVLVGVQGRLRVCWGGEESVDNEMVLRGLHKLSLGRHQHDVVDACPKLGDEIGLDCGLNDPVLTFKALGKRVDEGACSVSSNLLIQAKIVEAVLNAEVCLHVSSEDLGSSKGSFIGGGRLRD